MIAFIVVDELDEVACAGLDRKLLQAAREMRAVGAVTADTVVRVTRYDTAKSLAAAMSIYPERREALKMVCDATVPLELDPERTEGFSIVRPSLPELVSAFDEIAKQSFGSNVGSAARIASMARGRRVCGAVARGWNGLAGAILFSTSNAEVEILAIETVASVMRHGVASTLIGLAMREGPANLVVTVDARNAPAIALYRKLGFLTVDRIVDQVAKLERSPPS